MLMYNDDFEIDLDNTEDVRSFGPAPIGSHLCRLQVGELESIGNNGSRGFRIKARVVEPPHKGRTVEDTLFISPNSMPRLKLVLRNIAGINSGKLNAWAIRDAPNGQLARLTV